MVKRLLGYSPQEMIKLSPSELLLAIRMSEGRTIMAGSRARGPNLVQYVSNVEMCAASGCDIVGMGGVNADTIQFPGLPSKNPEDDEPFRDVQVPLGKGWTIREVKELIGRPMAMGFLLEPDYGAVANSDTAFMDKVDKRSPGLDSLFLTEQGLEYAIEQGVDIITIIGWNEPENFLRQLEAFVKQANGRVLIDAGIPHGPGLFHADKTPYNLRDIMTPELAANLVKAGANIVTYPAVGSLPGFTREYVTDIVSAIHAEGGLANANIHNSQEGTDIQTIRQIGLLNKETGADIQVLGDAGINEGMGSPEVIQALCIAVKGHRHTYRRIAESVLR